ncbi:phosphate ABC transporter ATP-binding protein [bacterium]|nr:phosphate ABC transporter ATP-binding protein [bacterium]|tara:strand:- start:348 stop:1109 length:762 start_codon:yes stop_codon:yes gene_type:complete
MKKDTILTVENLEISVKKNKIIKNISLSFYKNNVTAIMGPSGCGKTTLIRALNRMHDLDKSFKVKGSITFDTQNLLKSDPILVRQQIGMVFQRPNPFPNMSIYENVLAGYILNGIKLSKDEKDSIVDINLKKVGLYDEVSDNIHRKGSHLSGGQQQRLCIARTLAMKPKVLLLDEPTSALDPKATTRIENLINELKKEVSIIMVTHNIEQASRVSDYTAFLYLGDLIEYNTTETIFTVPKDKRTEEYLSRKYG